MLLKELLSLDAPSGHEDGVREFLKANIRADEIFCDSMGNLIAHKKGCGKRVMLAAHMDEVGIIVSGINEDGTLRFKTVGGIEPAVLCGKRFSIGPNKVTGISGVKAFHLQDAARRKDALKVSELYLDIGAKSAKEAGALIGLGDYGTFHSEYVEFGDGLIKCKALDDRVGCAILAELLNEDFALDIYAAFTVQEEVGLRGAAVAANRIRPDAALVIEGTTCSDVSGTEKHQTVTTLGKGAVLTVMDRSAVADAELLERIKSAAAKNGIAYQLKRMISGGTDAGSIYKSGGGVKTAVIAVPCRYIHSPVSVMSEKDFYGAHALSRAALREMETWNF